MLARVSLGYWVPSSPMPRTALREPDRAQPAAPDQPELGQGLDGVLATGRHESTRRQPQRGHHVSVELDHVHHRAPWRGAEIAKPGSHRRAVISLCERRRPDTNCSRRRADDASRLPGSARITTRSAGSRSSTTVRATCRNRRATRWRSTAEPTDLPTTKPIRGPAAPLGSRRRCTTRSGCAARTPCLTVAPNSVDRVIRYCAGSTSLPEQTQAVSERRPLRRRPVTIARPARVRIRRRNPCTRARRRLFGWNVRLPLATAVSPHCVWPPQLPIGQLWQPLVSSAVLLRSRRAPHDLE